MVGQRKLLVVDDQRDICEVIQSCLAQHSYDVDYATDSLSAKRKLEADTYDLVIIDMVMPGEGDLQLIKFAEAQGIPVLLTSGHPEMIAEVAQRFPYPLLPKPFHLNELKGAVRTAIRVSHDRDPNGLRLGDDECAELKPTRRARSRALSRGDYHPIGSK
jgi:DNA-binding NtrC family response regulator